MNIHYEPKPIKVHEATLKRRQKKAALGVHTWEWAEDRSLLGSFMAKLCYTGDCIVWTATINDAGYGVLMVDRKPVRAHRLAYEFQYGPIPDGLQIDHLCRNRCCVNPAHLEAVTCKVNVHRGEAKAQWEAKAAQTHCKHGHEFTPINTRLIDPQKPHWRNCKTCHYYIQKGNRLMKRFGYEPRSL